MELKITIRDAAHMGYRADDAGSDKAATTRELTNGTPPAVLAGLGAVGGRFDQQTRFSHQAATLAGDRAAQIALRGRHEEVNRGDGSIFDQVLEVAANRWVAVGDAVEASGASPEEADAEANKAIGTTNPEANFSADAIEALSAGAPLPGIALRGADGPQQNGPRIDPAQAGDGSSAGEVIEVLEDKENAAYKGALSGGANPNDAQAAADKAVGRADPGANFSANTSPVDATNVSRARRLATALRPSGLRRATSEGQTTPGSKIPTLGFPRFA